MVLAFMLASLLPWVHNKPGFYLVLGSSNVDEGLRGYLTKYDCSSADINPIGSISKQDLRRFLRWAATHLGYASLAEIEAAPPTAELEPIWSNYSQVLSTFEDLGISVDVATSEISISLTLDPSKLWSRELIQQASELDHVVEELKKIAVVNLLQRQSIISLTGNVQRSSLILEKASKRLSQRSLNSITAFNLHLVRAVDSVRKVS